MQMDESFLSRGVNEGFSGGEKKRNEILQMLVLEPRLAILDESDSGLDIDALRRLRDGVNSLRDPERAIVMVTHYQRLLDHVQPTQVHVLARGRIVRSGGPELARELEQRGYDWLLEPAPFSPRRLLVSSASCSSTDGMRLRFPGLPRRWMPTQRRWCPNARATSASAG
jgi:Fe-S cluster assembly ATP-binding protein